MLTVIQTFSLKKAATSLFAAALLTASLSVQAIGIAEAQNAKQLLEAIDKTIGDNLRKNNKPQTENLFVSMGPEGFNNCPQLFPNNNYLPYNIDLIGSDMRPMAFCSDQFAVVYSGRTKTPLLVIERLNKDMLELAKETSRKDIKFMPDDRILWRQFRAELSDYQGSGYQRGHMSPAANQAGSKAMIQSFALTNIVPQDPYNNEKIWSKIESDVRKYIRRADGDVFVFTGPLFRNTTLWTSPSTKQGSSVQVPSHLFKLVYDPSTQRAWGYHLENNASAVIERLDYQTFVKATGWGLLDHLPVRPE